MLWRRLWMAVRTTDGLCNEGSLSPAMGARRTTPWIVVDLRGNHRTMRVAPLLGDVE
jgi:hypothetical protein